MCFVHFISWLMVIPRILLCLSSSGLCYGVSMWTWKDDVSWKCSWLGTWQGGIACPMLLPIRWACRGRFGVYDDPYLIWLSGRAQCRLQRVWLGNLLCLGGHWCTEGRGPGLRQIPVVLRMWRRSVKSINAKNTKKITDSWECGREHNLGFWWRWHQPF